MATNSNLDYKWGNNLVKQEDDDDEKHVEEEEDEEEEALSLCDLPVTLINDNDQDKSRKQDTKFAETEEHEEEEEEDFDFKSLGGLFSEEPEMCVADEVFFQGQILPFRHSFSSEPSLFKTKGSLIQNDDSNKQLNHGESRSESMDNVSTSEFGSNSNTSSRSCSLRSQNSSSSTSSSTTTTIRVSKPKPKIRNQFHTIPSPKPQLRQSRSGTRQTVLSFNNQVGRKSSSSTWEFFRLGVAPAPEMLGLQDLKFRNSSANNRNCVTRNSSSSSSNNSKNSSSCSTKKSSFNNGGKDGDHKGNNNHGLKQFVGKGGGLLSGCSCTVDSVVAQMDTVMIKSTNNNNTKIKTESVEAIKTTTHAMKEKVVVAKLNKDQQKNKNNKKHNSSNNNAVRHKQQGKKVMMSRRRMFEWLKELHAIRNREDEEALLSNNT